GRDRRAAARPRLPRPRGPRYLHPRHGLSHRPCHPRRGGQGRRHTPDRQRFPPARQGALMFRTMFKSKIHRATVTQADLHYVGSLTSDQDRMDAADLLPGEQVHVADSDNGARLETYLIAGERGSGVIGTNGAAARLVQPGDLVIIISYAQLSDA